MVGFILGLTKDDFNIPRNEVKLHRWPVGTRDKPMTKADREQARKAFCLNADFIRVVHDKEFDRCTVIQRDNVLMSAGPCVVHPHVHISAQKDIRPASVTWKGVMLTTIASVAARYQLIKIGEYERLTRHEKWLFEGSHLCPDQPNCMAHVCLESCLDNNRRKGCAGIVTTPRGRFRLCSHGPTYCVTVTEADESD